MTTIDDLNKSISEMTSEELMSRLSNLRKARRIKPQVTNIRPKKPSQVTAKHSLAAMLKNFSIEELQALCKEE